jgi:hypothetical protein
MAIFENVGDGTFGDLRLWRLFWHANPVFCLDDREAGASEQGGRMSRERPVGQIQWSKLIVILRRALPSEGPYEGRDLAMRPTGSATLHAVEALLFTSSRLSADVRSLASASPVLGMTGRCSG